MAELTQRERLQPWLLDRLIDDEPGKSDEPRERRVLSLRSLRQAVLRDLAWLLNTTHLRLLIEREKLPYLSSSVLNYGMPDISGVSSADLDAAQLERDIRQVIWNFEPRLVRASVRVKALPAGHDLNKLLFEIEADLWALPYPEHLYLKTEMDLQSAAVSLTEISARSTA